MQTHSPGRNPEPPVFLQLAGHPLRWRLLGELAYSDRTVFELTHLVGEQQNLVSYHLAKLRDAGLVSTRRSSADRRDAYYKVELTRVRELLSATGGALHPGLRLAPPTPAAVMPKTRVLFLCTGNSARSQIASALIHALSNEAVEAKSAGSHPKPLHPNAVRTMHEDYGIDISGNTTTHLDRFRHEHFDWVISLCDKVREVCPEFPDHPEVIHWSIPDPAAGELDDDASYPVFRDTAAELETRIRYLLDLFTSMT